MTNTNEGRGVNRVIALLLFLILMALVVLIVLVFRFLERPPSSPTMVMIPAAYAANAQVGQAGLNGDDLQAELNRQTEEGMISFTLNAAPVFQDGSSMGDLKLECPAENHGELRFIIRRSDTGDTVYDSGAMLPGSYIETDKLQTAAPLPAGEYPCAVDILLLDSETHAERGKVQSAITITVRG